MVEAIACDFSELATILAEDLSSYEQMANEENAKVWLKEVDKHFVIRGTATVTGDYELAKLFDIPVDLTKRMQWQDKIKKAEVVEKQSDTADVVYLEMAFPFPLENRDFVTQRIHFSNKKHPELVTKYGLPVKDNEYCVIASKSVTRADKAVVKGKTRADMKLAFFIFEQDAADAKKFHLTFFNHTDMKLSVKPDKAKAGKSAGKDLNKKLAEAYKKIYK